MEPTRSKTLIALPFHIITVLLYSRGREGKPNNNTCKLSFKLMQLTGQVRNLPGLPSPILYSWHLSSYDLTDLKPDSINLGSYYNNSTFTKSFNLQSPLPKCPDCGAK